METTNRIKSFVWRYGSFVGLAIATYLANIANIRDIDFNKLGTIFTITTAAFVVNEITKYYNTKPKPLEAVGDVRSFGKILAVILGIAATVFGIIKFWK